MDRRRFLFTLTAGDWPQFLGPARDGSAQEAGWGPGEFRVAWKKAVGAGFAGPVVSQGKLIIFHRIGGEEIVEAWDARSAARLWAIPSPTRYRDDFGFDEGPRAAATVSGGRVFTQGAAGMLEALDFATGKRLWSVATMEKYGVAKNFFGAAGSPVVHENLVLLNVGGRERAGIVAFDAATGREVWRATNDEASYSTGTIAPWNGKPHAFFLTRAGLVAVEVGTGKVVQQVRWRSRSSASVNAATPLVVGDEIFLSASYGTGATVLKMAGPVWKPLWASDDSLSNHYSTSVVNGGYLYGFHGRQEEGQAFRCVEWKTGKVMWSEEGFGAGTVTLVNGKFLLTAREDGELVWASANPRKWEVLSRGRTLGGTVRSYPAVANGRVYLRNERELTAVVSSSFALP